jgi:hypothetical protein
MAKKPRRKSGAPSLFDAEPERLLEQLYAAYRKAKADVFYESAQPFAIDFHDYELKLDRNLNKLANRLRNGQWDTDAEFIGDLCCIPKGGLRYAASDKEGDGPRISISDPRKLWEEQRSRGNISVEFRPVAHFSVDMYVVCALWVNLIGHRFDACLDNSAYGSRVRRYRSPEDSGSRDYHDQAQGTFEPYFFQYHNWRENGLNSIRTELRAGRDVIAMTMDVTSFYHNIDATFLLNDDFLAAIEFERVNGMPLSKEDIAFTHQLTKAFETWATQHGVNREGPVGVPVGPSAARIIANVLLREFDKQLQQGLSPVYYGRYVDDIFLVLRDHGQFLDAESIVKWLVDHVSMLEQDDDKRDLKLSINYGCRTDLRFKQEKQRIFMLSGGTGQDLLDAIESKIDEVSSEHRMLPELDTLTRTPSAKVLTASSKSTEDADSLRKADGLTVKRMGFALMLRSTDKFARDLPAREWREERLEFYDFVKRHVLTPARFMELSDYLPRIISLAIHCKDWRQAAELLDQTRHTITEIGEHVTVIGDSGQLFFDRFKEFIAIALREAVAKSVPVELLGKASTKAKLRTIFKRVDFISSDFWASFLNDYSTIAKTLFLQDLSRRPLKEAVLEDVKVPRLSRKCDWIGSLPPKQQVRATTIAEFLQANAEAKQRSNKVRDLRGFLFPTRPLHPAEVTDCVPQCNRDIVLWGRYVQALRGAWVKPRAWSLFDGVRPTKRQNKPLVIGGKRRQNKVRIAIPSVLVEESSWARAADGRPDESKHRYSRLVRLSRSIGAMPRSQRPHYVLFPELSMPWRFMPTIVNHFLKQRISVIAGMEYRPGRQEHQLINEAKMFLTDDRLGFSSWSVFTQQKGVPAKHEKSSLQSMFGKEFAPANELSKKWIIRHFGFDFGLLICSELTNIDHRRDLRGKVDCLFALAWNRDLDSFSALIESAALDIHCFVALVNNRLYGDSRIRAPFKAGWKRDVVRVKGGIDDYFVVAEIDVNDLRGFQSHHDSPDTQFKPLPEGYQIRTSRRQTPLPIRGT